MADLASFPEDDNLWFVKWIDQFRYVGDAHTPYVSVLLQRLPFSSADQLNALIQSDVETILGLVQDGASQFKRVEVLVGSLPNISIGTTFRNRSFIGELPLCRHEIILPNPDCSSIKLGDSPTPPTSWKSAAQYRWLNRYEYSGILPTYINSRCFHHIENDIDYLIPNTTILKRFFAPHTSFANAIIGLPWEFGKNNIIHFGEMESGYKTCICSNPRAWNVIIKGGLSKNYAFLAALLHFDSYAHRCANLIHTEAQRSMTHAGGNIAKAEWHCNARIPFTKTEKPLEMSVKGFLLNSSKTGARKKFVVASITKCSTPNYIPSICAALFNSNEKGKTIIPSNEEQPYARSKNKPLAGSELVVIDSQDSIKDMKPAVLYTEEHEWLDLPLITWQQKESSKSYIKPPTVIPPPPVNNKNVSSGVAGTQSSSLPPINFLNPVRRSSHRFKLIINAMNELSQKGALSYSIYQPYNSSLVTNRGGYICWNFLSEEVREGIKLIDEGWRIIRSQRDENSDLPPIPRAALILKIQYELLSGYWIEIENSNNDPGSRSPFVFQKHENMADSLMIVLDSVAALKGVSLLKHLQPKVSEKIKLQVESYRHQYEKNSNPQKLSNESILTHLNKCLKRYIAESVTN